MTLVIRIFFFQTLILSAFINNNQHAEKNLTRNEHRRPNDIMFQSKLWIGNLNQLKLIEFTET